LKEKYKNRFWSKVNKKDSNQCWEWLACKNQYGYGLFNTGPRGNGSYKSSLAHRIAYELSIGQISTDTLHHKCGNRSCVNPSHLEPINRGQNVILGNSTAGKNVRKLYCKKGHLLIIDSFPSHANKGWRYCPVCMKEKNQNRKEKRDGRER